MTKIIAFAGRKQSGKTTCSEWLQRVYSKLKQNEDCVKIYNFADTLKQDICMNILGLSYEQCYGSDDDKNTITDIRYENNQLTAREVMQLVGTDIFRKMKPSVWTEATINKIAKDNKDLAIIADCRFPNEVEIIKQAGGTVIKLMRNPFNSDHASETALDPNNYQYHNFDFVLMNQSMTIDEQLVAIFKYLRKKGILPL